jgi:hypothetical protein
MPTKNTKCAEVVRDLETLLAMTEGILNCLANEGCYPESEVDEDHNAGQTWWKRLNEIRTRYTTKIR